MPEVDVLARQLKRYRRTANKTQCEMSSEMGICAGELGLLERGKTNPKLSTMQRIASYMGVTVSDLLRVEDGGPHG